MTSGSILESSSSEVLECRLLLGGGVRLTEAGDVGRLCEGPGSVAEVEGTGVGGLSTGDVSRL